MPAYDYKEPKLFHYDYDLSRQWYVEVSVLDPATGKYKRFQSRGKINSYKTKQQRIAAASVSIEKIKASMKSGEADPFGDGKASDTPKSIEEAIDRILELKKASLKKKSITGYTEISGRFKTFCKKKGYGMLPLGGFTNTMARAYLDHMILSRKHSGKTHNNHVGVLRTFFSSMIDKWPQSIQANPFKAIKMLPTAVGGNLAYTDKERETLIKYFRENDVRMYYAIQFMFHCFIRKTELTFLKVRDINWESGTITINAYAAKNGKQENVTIPKGLMPVLLEMGLDKAPKDHYIFGYGIKTCAEKMNKPDNLSDAHMRGKEKAGFEKGDGKTFYSWKHTGVIAYWNVIKDPYMLMRQLRHSDLKITMIYLKSLGLMPNIAFTNAAIDL